MGTIQNVISAWYHKDSDVAGRQKLKTRKRLRMTVPELPITLQYGIKISDATLRQGLYETKFRSEHDFRV